MSERFKTFCVATAAAALLLVAGLAFWVQDWQYSLPTPRPIGLVQPAFGSTFASYDDGLSLFNNQPKFLHFFNPDCPCSQFNLDHIRALYAHYGKSVDFVAVVETTGDIQAPPADNWGLPMRAVIDHGGRIAHHYGVYSTPQAVVMTAKGSLYYRGNYNISRYCDVHSTEFARIALDRLLQNKPAATIQPAASIAYGCQLPANAQLPVCKGKLMTMIMSRLPGQTKQTGASTGNISGAAQ